MQANKGGKKKGLLDPKKSGLSGVKNDVVRANLMGVSEKMNKKGWTDAQGRKGKVLGIQDLLRRLADTYHLVDVAQIFNTCRASAFTDTLTSTVPMLTDTHQSTHPTPGPSQAAVTPLEPRV